MGMGIANACKFRLLVKLAGGVREIVVCGSGTFLLMFHSYRWNGTPEKPPLWEIIKIKC